MPLVRSRDVYGPLGLSGRLAKRAPRYPTGEEILRPISDVDKSAGITYSSGSEAWSLVDEVVLNTADYFSLGGANMHVIMQLQPSSLTPLTADRIDFVMVAWAGSNGAPAAAIRLQMRDPRSGIRYDIGSGDIGQNTSSPRFMMVPVHPWDGSPWMFEDVARLQCGYRSSSSGPFSDVTQQMWVTVGWSADY